ncbi:hypothetical protein BC938DRAFT_473022 [Jimgerdemannia flammicorona]|uniref:Protein ARV n=1 Tax=Jimgerdemannia flammicorona TaxID=994334 RepID=A0A433Q4Y0_9FUNG|nr:hypothetical protein BC938DRAFT_473022 [Jimgerdemannia flammicorona]
MDVVWLTSHAFGHHNHLSKPQPSPHWLPALASYHRAPANLICAVCAVPSSPHTPALAPLAFQSTMPTCVECGEPVTNLYTEYSKGNIRLTHCTLCIVYLPAKRFPLFFFLCTPTGEMQKIRRQVCRARLCHHLHRHAVAQATGLPPPALQPSGLPGPGHRRAYPHYPPCACLRADLLAWTTDLTLHIFTQPSVMKLAILLILFEFIHSLACPFLSFTLLPADIKWFRLEKNYTREDFAFIEQPLTFQYLYILFLCILVFHIAVRSAVKWYLGTKYTSSPLHPPHQPDTPHQPDPVSPVGTTTYRWPSLSPLSARCFSFLWLSGTTMSSSIRGSSASLSSCQTSRRFRVGASSSCGALYYEGGGGGSGCAVLVKYSVPQHRLHPHLHYYGLRHRLQGPRPGVLPAGHEQVAAAYPAKCVNETRINARMLCIDYKCGGFGIKMHIVDIHLGRTSSPPRSSNYCDLSHL